MAIKDVEKRIAAKFPGLTPIELPEEPATTKTVMQWVTAMDDKVCAEYCQPLDGKQWEIDDARMPTPPDSTHPNCRCQLQLVEIPRTEELVTSEEAALIAVIETVSNL